MAKKTPEPAPKDKEKGQDTENETLEPAPKDSKFSGVFKDVNTSLDEMQSGVDELIKIKLQKSESVSRLNNMKKDLVRLKKELSVYSNE